MLEPSQPTKHKPASWQIKNLYENNINGVEGSSNLFLICVTKSNFKDIRGHLLVLTVVVEHLIISQQW